VICEWGDVVIVPFPFTDNTGIKRRPSAILSTRSFNEANGHSICAMITTASNTRWPSDHIISDIKMAGLARQCVVRWKLFTLPNDLILRKAGELAAQDRDAIRLASRSVME
jgi:mRNA interferase MazF